MNVTIRPATEADLPAIHQLVRELAIYERAEEQFTADLDTYRADFREGAFEALVAEEGGTVVGMALYYLTYSTWKGKMLYLEDFVVRPERRRQGIGRFLFEAFLTQAVKRDCRLVKWQVLDWNTPALRFYERYGALIEREWWNGKIFLSDLKKNEFT